VQYQAFDFRIIQTEHFEIYYYPASGRRLWTPRVASGVRSPVPHPAPPVPGPKPIILYVVQSDFQQTNTTGETSARNGRVHEFFKHRMVLPFTGSYAAWSTCWVTRWCTSSSIRISRGRIGPACRRW